MSQEKANINLTNWDIVGINPNDKNWSSGDIFCFWANNIQSLIGFSLIASLYLVYDLNILIVFISCILAGFLVAIFSNLLGNPSQKYGLPFPVILRVSFGLNGARYIGMLRGVVNSGQVCTSIERVYVYNNVADRFTEALVEEAEKVQLGDPMDKNTDVGPMASKAQLKNTVEKVELAKKEGARLLTGGGRPTEFSRGYFFSPTVFDRVTPDMEIVTEESFSPVIPIQKINSLDEAVAMANSTKYGLGCTIFTKDIERALTAADKIKSGTVCINNPLMENIAAPFGGMKQSGIGREHGIEALEEFREAKHIYIDYDHSKKSWWF